MPSRRFSPVTALQPWMHQWWLWMESSSRAWGARGRGWWAPVTTGPATQSPFPLLAQGKAVPPSRLSEVSLGPW